MESESTIQQYNNITIEKFIGVLLVLFAIGFNLWVYRLEPSALVDPNDNAFQYALVDRTNQIWSFADKKCSSPKEGSHPMGWKDAILPFLPFRTFCQVSYLADHWVPNWAEGYNLPYYYSHIPQILIVASWRLLSSAIQQFNNITISLYSYYHLVIYLLLCFFPLSVYLALRVLRLTALTSGLGALIASQISTDGLYGLDPPSFLWRGWGLSSQLFAMIFLPLAIAHTWKFLQSNLTIYQYNNVTMGNKLKKWIVSMISQKDFILGVMFLTFTTAGHLGLGMIAFLSIAAIAISPFVASFLASPSQIAILLYCYIAKRKNTANRQQYNNITIQQLFVPIKKLFILFGLTILILSYWIVPAFLGDMYHNFSVWDPLWKFNSYGVFEILKNFFNGDLFDFGRFPVLTLLVLIGLFTSLWSSNNLTIQQYNNDKKTLLTEKSLGCYFPFGLLFIFWFLMYFGRSTWGGLLDFIPGLKEFHQSRFLIGVHLAGLFLIPIGIQFLIQQFSNLAIQQSNQIVKWLYCYIVKMIVIIGVILLVYPQTIRYATHNDFLIKRANADYLKIKPDIDSLISKLSALGSTRPGRVYSGRGGSWGRSLRVAETPLYMYLSTYGLPTVLWLPETWSPNSDTEQFMSEDNLYHYLLYNIRYIVTPNPPVGEPMPFWKLLKETPSWRLYEVSKASNVSMQKSSDTFDTSDTSSFGYLAAGIRPAIVASSKYDFINLIHLWIQSDYPKQGLYPQLLLSNNLTMQQFNNLLNNNLPRFTMRDEATYETPARNASSPADAGGPDLKLHSLFSEPPRYSISQQCNNVNNITILSQKDEADMVFTAKIEVKQSCPESLVILRQSYHPSWRATIDGEPVEPINVFPFYNAILIKDPGIHEVVFSYQPSPVKIVLLVLSLISLIALISLSVVYSSFWRRPG